MRGKVSLTTPSSVATRITPAHAGKRRHQGRCPRVGRDHPRTCGEKVPDVPVAALPQGSPPHMRGKGAIPSALSFPKRITPAHAGKSPSCLLIKATRPGITPAHAGKSGSQMEQAEEAPDHPRTCGEKRPPTRLLHHVRGSPPHMRGKALGALLPLIRAGITPAHAGKSG